MKRVKHVIYFSFSNLLDGSQCYTRPLTILSLDQEELVWGHETGDMTKNDGVFYQKILLSVLSIVQFSISRSEELRKGSNS